LSIFDTYSVPIEHIFSYDLNSPISKSLNCRFAIVRKITLVIRVWLKFGK